MAILLVLLWHYRTAIPTEPGTPPAYFVRATFFMMWSGVDLFFVLSGFLIGGILIDNRQAKNYFRVFYTRRAFRILPIYMATVAVGFALAYFGLQYPAQTGQLRLRGVACECLQPR